MAETACTDEPLAELAHLARHIAPQTCRRDPRTGSDCAWYHGFWPTLRLTGLVTAPVHHQAFYARALPAIATAHSVRRILISGAADAGMLAQVAAAYGPASAGLDLTVLDLCETPLALNRRYAEIHQLRITTRAVDILDYEGDRAFDLICTHSFLGRFDAARRPRLLARWRALLRPGGAAVTVNRLRPHHRVPVVGFSPEQAEQFVASVRSRATSVPALAGQAEALAEAARVYAERHHVVPVQSRDELVTLFESAGLRIDSLEVSGLREDAGPPSGPTVRSTADYAAIVARRLD